MADLVHESYAVGLSLLTTQRDLEPIPGYPMYDRYIRILDRLIGANVHPWVALTATRAAAMACMQTAVLSIPTQVQLSKFVAAHVPLMERPNHRLATLLDGSFADAVAREQREAVRKHGDDAWWHPKDGVRLSPESMDGDAAASSAEMHDRLMADAMAIIAAQGGTAVEADAHHDELRALLEAARALVSGGLLRIGALTEAPGLDLIHGGPLDGQTIELTLAPKRAVVLPYGEVSGASGQGPGRHLFVAVTTPTRLRSSHDLEGLPLPDTDAVSVIRSTVFDGDTRDAVLLVMVDSPGLIKEAVPVYVSLLSSAMGAAPEMAATWIRAFDADRVSIVMDTPATAAILRWCVNGAQFHTDTNQVRVEGEEIRVIFGRVVRDRQRSPLVVIPSTEFGARWFESVLTEDDTLRSVVVDDAEMFKRESAHLDIVLNHLLYEERFLGTGSWRR